MGCLYSKPQEDVGGDAAMKAAVPASAAAVAQHQRQAAVSEAERREETHPPGLSGVPDWSERSDDLKSHILYSRPSDKRIESYIASLSDLAKRSVKKREYFGDTNVIQSLLMALRDGPPSVAKVSAHALKLLTFCHPNHKCAANLVRSQALHAETLAAG
jgi:hypothetical protein